jgi:hypothetical protein
VKNKELIITTLVFFLLVNTSYYWEGKLGHGAFPVFMILILVFIGLAIALLRQLVFALLEKFSSRQRIFTMGFMASVLAVTFLKPAGLINFDKFEGEDILVASREGAANCMTVFKLKDNKKFSEVTHCFGVSQYNGYYTLKNDTIFFEKIEKGRDAKEFYRFAVIKPSKFNANRFDLVRFKNLEDTAGHRLWIWKNDLPK